MEETRTSKYKDYRKSILTEDAASSFSSRDVLKGDTETKTLPIDQVIEQRKEEKKFDLALFFRKNATLLTIIAIVIGLSVIILGIILWAKNIWRS